MSFALKTWGFDMNKLDSTFNFHQTSLRLLGDRQSVLASNIANEETPNYKARDIAFTETLNQILNSQKQSVRPPEPTVQYRQSAQPTADGNTVDGNTERQHFTDNAIRYETSLTLLRTNMKDLMAVLQS